MSWCAKNGIEAPSVEVDDVGGYRGVRAKTTLAANAPLVVVPAKLTLETTTLQQAPPKRLADATWLAPGSWAASPWYVRLALLLLRERELGAASPLAPWLAALPRPESFHGLPFYWSDDERGSLQVGSAACRRHRSRCCCCQPQELFPKQALCLGVIAGPATDITRLWAGAWTQQQSLPTRALPPSLFLLPFLSAP